jgi:hypothetical protein
MHGTYVQKLITGNVKKIFNSGHMQPVKVKKGLMHDTLHCFSKNEFCAMLHCNVQ